MLFREVGRIDGDSAERAERQNAMFERILDRARVIDMELGNVRGINREYRQGVLDAEVFDDDDLQVELHCFGDGQNEK